ncbi:hypothetical protein SAMN05428959_105370 [Duganella sp. CF517]|uniref:tetratricopeptide repeat protein n=1 Tax=Duganella sp. CF517 TaxID=1881038 RepID=UPI0008B6D26A|nr:tetratricopeptide repeat protein [Duganella sp. CF517]SEO21059.1 hypothetical protein SAMN05428959_105370 [Duganella sp. CF517]
MSRRRPRRAAPWLAALLGVLAGGAGAAAPADDAGAPAAISAAPDLYMDAMRALSEGRQDDAAAILERMHNLGPRHAGEWLDLALIHCALGNAARAEALFTDIESRFAPPAGIRNIIANQRKLGCLGWQANRQWTLGLARGSDSNANQGATNGNFIIDGAPAELLAEFRPRPDQFSTVTLDYFRELNRDGDIGWFQAGARRYDQLSQYNTTSLFAGAEHPWRAGAWEWRASAMAGVVTLNGRLYQQQGQLQLRATPPLALPAPFKLQVSAAVTRLNYKTLSNFGATTFELRTLLDYRKDTVRLQASAGLLDDRGNGARPGGDRHGWSARLYGRRALLGPLQGELDLSYLHWQGEAIYSARYIETLRRQRTGALRAALIYPLGAAHSVQLEWRQIDNRENISIFQYRSRQLQLSWLWNAP